MSIAPFGETSTAHVHVVPFITLFGDPPTPPGEAGAEDKYPGTPSTHPRGDGGSENPPVRFAAGLGGAESIYAEAAHSTEDCGDVGEWAGWERAVEW